jgi:hypothetical protein
MTTSAAPHRKAGPVSLEQWTVIPEFMASKTKKPLFKVASTISKTNISAIMKESLFTL